jgi:hypothetical protein
MSGNAQGEPPPNIGSQEAACGFQLHAPLAYVAEAACAAMSGSPTQLRRSKHQGQDAAAAQKYSSEGDGTDSPTDGVAGSRRRGSRHGSNPSSVSTGTDAAARMDHENDGAQQQRGSGDTQAAVTQGEHGRNRHLGLLCRRRWSS